MTSRPLPRLVAASTLALTLGTLSACSRDEGTPSPESSAPSSSSVDIQEPDVPSGDTAVDSEGGDTGVDPDAYNTVSPYLTSEGEVLAGASEELIAALEQEATSPADSVDPRALDAAAEFTAVYFGQRSSDEVTQRWLDRLAPTLTGGYEKRLRDSADSATSNELSYTDPQGREWEYEVEVEELLPSEWFPITSSEVTISVTFTSQLEIEGQSNGKAAPRTMFVRTEKSNGVWKAAGLKDSGDRTAW